jgi:hypothetical protein
VKPKDKVLYIRCSAEMHKALRKVTERVRKHTGEKVSFAAVVRQMLIREIERAR